MNLKLRLIPATWCVAMLSFCTTGLHGAPGDVDPTFNASANGKVNCASVQPDGKIILGGAFTTVGNTTHNYLARLNTDGSVDPNFTGAPNDVVYTSLVQPDGKIILGGKFIGVSSSSPAREFVARLNTDGSVDTAFVPAAPNAMVTCLALQADGKLIIGGYFTSVGAFGRGYIARLNTDGSLDSTFNPNADEFVQSIAIQPDGKILIGGYFSTVGGTSRTRMARLNTDGSLDTTFTTTVDAAVYSLTLQTDGKVLIGGQIYAVDGVSRTSITRLNSDGTLDTTFADAAPNGTVLSMTEQANGKVVIGGYFNLLGSTPYSRLARLNTDGTVDTTFSATSTNAVYSTCLQADGRILVAADSGNTPDTVLLERLLNDPPAEKILVTGTATNATVQWLLGGSAPNTLQTTFEVATSGGGWGTPVAAKPITGGWQATGLNLAVAGSIRARGRTLGSYYDASVGLVELVANYPTPDIDVEQPSGTALASGGTLNFGETVLGTTLTRIFTIRNAGQGTLNLSGITLSGANTSEFQLNTGGTGTTLASGGSTTLSVTFAPTGSSAFRNAVLQLASNANGTNSPFTVALAGLGLSNTSSTGGDGLNDHAKYLLAALGFNWQVSQPALVQALYGGANSAGLYTASQVQALNVGTPVIQRDASTGQFKLTISLQQSADLKTYTPLSLGSGSATIDAAGALEFLFNGPSGAVFFRVQAQ